MEIQMFKKVIIALMLCATCLYSGEIDDLLKKKKYKEAAIAAKAELVKVRNSKTLNCLQKIILTWAKSDPAKAFSCLEDIGNKDDKAYLMYRVVTIWAETDTNKAYKAIARIPKNGQEKAAAIMVLRAVMKKQGPEKAEKWIERLKGKLKHKAYLEVVNEYTTTKKFKIAEKKIAKLKVKKERDPLMHRLALCHTNYEDALRIAKAIKNKKLEDSIYCDRVKQDSLNIGEATRIANMIVDDKVRFEALSWILRIRFRSRFKADGLDWIKNQRQVDRIKLEKVHVTYRDTKLGRMRPVDLR